MPVCEICDSETFESRNGLYYCLTCGTQSQDLRDELVEEQVEVDQRLVVSTTKGKKGRKAFERVAGKPWLMQEAHQIILQKQVEFLIKNDVDPRIKDVVGQLWFKYLSVTGIAFCTSKDGTSIGRQTETGVYEHNARAYGQEKQQKKRKNIKEEDDDMLELCSEIAKEEFCQGDDPMDKDSSDSDDDQVDSSSDDAKSDLELGYIGSYAVFKIGSKRRKTQIRTTVALTYLGLLLLNEPIFLSDLLRWIREGHFPYLEAASLLPSYMKFSKKDSHMLTAISLPTKEQLFLDCAYLIKLLKLSLPEQDIRKYTTRYILNLNLPAITHGFVNNLLIVYQPDTKFWKLNQKVYRSQSLHFEETSMAYIFIALKMCYGLDDAQDESEANLAQNLTSPQSRDSLPVWRDWVSASRQCQNKMMASGVPWTQEELRQLRDSRTYTTFCKSHVFGACARRDREMTTDVKDSVISARRKYFRKEYRESFVELFSSIVGETSTDDAPPPPTSFPDTCRHGNKTSNENQEHCFSESTTRRIPLESFAQLCAPTETETQDKDEEREAVPLSKRKYIKYFRLDTNRDASHSSFRFLVDLMATHIETKPEVLEVTIMKMESLLLDD